MCSPSGTDGCCPPQVPRAVEVAKEASLPLMHPVQLRLSKTSPHGVKNMPIGCCREMKPAALRPAVTSMCQEMAVNGNIVCPFTLTGLVKLEKRMGKTVWPTPAGSLPTPLAPLDLVK